MARSGKKRIPVLMYHRIGPIRKDSIVAGQYVTPRAFNSHLQVMKRLGYSWITPEAAMDGAPGALLTFDDGYLDFYEFALPALQDIGGTATVFLVSDCVGGTNVWDTTIGDVTERLMDWEQIKKARKHGISFGSHTASHARLTEVTPVLLEHEIQSSKRQIEAELGESCPWFCYPYGGMNETVAAAVKSAGYRGAFATTKGGFLPGRDPYAIPRINVRADTTAAILAYKVFRAVKLGR